MRVIHPSYWCVLEDAVGESVLELVRSFFSFFPLHIKIIILFHSVKVLVSSKYNIGI